MADQPVASLAKTRQTISTRLLAESLRTYGAIADERTIQSWISSALAPLLTEETRVTQFVYVLALRDIRERADRYMSEAA